MSTKDVTLPGGMKLTPAMIDAAVIQLKSVIDTADDIPENVRKSGKQFVSDLDQWSEAMKKDEEKS